MGHDRNRRPGALLVLGVLALVLATVVGPTAGATPNAIGGSQIDPDSVLLRVDLESNGTAEWRVEYRIRLDDDNATRAFESLRSDVRANRSRFAGRFRERMRRTVAGAENATGRAMALRNVTVRTERTGLPQSYGVVTYAFEWVGFASLEDSRLRAGDAIGGLFLDEETTLLVRWPGAFRPVRARPEPDERRDRAIIWRGPTDFTAGEPSIRLARAPTPTPTESGRATGTGTAAPDGGETGAATGGSGRTAETAETAQTGDSRSPSGASGVGTDGGPSGQSADGDRPLPPLAAAIGLAALGAAAAAGWTVTRGGDAGDAGSPAGEELLSNEERVLALLEERGGRMKQQAVAEELGWTDAKTSQVVGRLREDDEIEAFRLGRENVLSLPGESDI